MDISHERPWILYLCGLSLCVGVFVSVYVASQEQKKSLPASALKTRTTQPSQGSAVPDILACMLKDTTSEHKAHLFDLKCKICTGKLKNMFYNSCAVPSRHYYPKTHCYF